MKTTRLRTNSCLGIPRSVTGFRESWAKLMALFNSSNRPSLFCLGAGLLCSMILLIHRQNNGSFRERTLKKQKTRIISCGKHSGKSEYTHNLIEETTHKVAFTCLTFPAGNLCHCLRFHLFQTPSRDLPLGWVSRATDTCSKPLPHTRLRIQRAGPTLFYILSLRGERTVLRLILVI